jgi:hypothetical protein
VRIGVALGVSSASAFAIGLIVHAAILVITSAGGIAALVRLGWAHAIATPAGATSEIAD